jgi:hypothetical protein
LERRTLGILSVLAILVIVGSGFIPFLTVGTPVALAYPLLTKTSVPHRSIEIVQTTSVSKSFSVTTARSVATIENEIYNVSSILIACNHWVQQAISISAGSDAKVLFSASGILNLYVFDRAQYSAYVSSNGLTTSPNVAQITQSSNGTAEFVAPATDSYYLVIKNPPGPTGCQEGSSVGLYSAQGYVVTEHTTEYFVTSTSAVSFTSNMTMTTTQYSVSSYTTTVESEGIRTCVLGWLQALLFGCS